MVNAPKKILLVEDSRAVQAAIRGLLDQYDLSSAFSEDECLAAVQQEQFDLVILDVYLADKMGWDTCVKIRAYENYKNVPIIFLTGARKPEELVRGFKVGGNDYIAKPFTPEELLVRVETHLRVRSLGEELTKQRELDAVNALRVTYNHEINNPLTIALHTLAKIKQSETKPDAEQIAKLEKSIHRIAELVRAITELKELKTKAYTDANVMIEIPTKKFGT